jgi:hypothetical protein
MTLIRVNPESVQRYGSEAQSIFDGMHGSLVAHVNEVVAVRYFGPNAVAFKTECGRLAADFANRLHADMGAMADAVRTSTSNIAASLGGAPIVIRLDPRAIVPPTPQTVDYVDVDTAALDVLVPVIGQRFEALRQGLTDHLDRTRSHRLGGQRQARCGRCRQQLHRLGPQHLRRGRAVDRHLRPQPAPGRHRRRPLIASRTTAMPAGPPTGGVLPAAGRTAGRSAHPP